MHAVRATDWKNASTWHWSIEPLFTNLKEKSPPPEDPFVYYEAGVFHGLFHDRSCTACGGHGYSLDGVAWFYTGVATVRRVRGEIMGSQKCRIVGKSQSVIIMTNPIIFTRTRRPQDYVEPHLLLHDMYLPAGVAYNGHTQLVDGTTYSFSRRERPHLVFRRPSDDSGAPLPIAITNGVQYGHGDQTTTLLQPLNTVASKTDDDTPMIITSIKCTSSYNCSLNGDCNASGLCVCDQGWSGQFCSQLDLLPVENGTGLDQLHGQHTSTSPASTWGGTVLYDNTTNLWHMWASEILHHCGIHRWVTNSVVVHATSDRADGVFTRKEEVFPLFSHEPTAARAPTGEYVLYLTHHNGSPAGVGTLCNCTSGSSGSGGTPDPQTGVGACMREIPNCDWHRDPELPFLSNCSMLT
eukprot:COSAG01_NODE_4444_length_5017_cov_4.901179_4_plen_409_part_00